MRQRVPHPVDHVGGTGAIGAHGSPGEILRDNPQPNKTSSNGQIERGGSAGTSPTHAILGVGQKPDDDGLDQVLVVEALATLVAYEQRLDR